LNDERVPRDQGIGRRVAMKFPEELLYTDTHEWVKNEGNRVTVGLTDYAQSQLKDIVYVDLPEIGSGFKKGESLGVVESVKTAADLFSPVSGKVTETNMTLKDSPQFINEDPYGKGWILKMDLQDKGELKKLLTSEAYQGSLRKEE
jgi:glycine cleavage system H protein